MMELVDDDRLGRLVSTHPVAVGRRWRTGGLALAIGLAGALFLAYLIGVAPAGGSGRPFLLGLIPMACCLPVALIQLTRAARSGRHETFELYENGLGRHASGVRRSWTWEQVVEIRVKSMEGTLWARFGWNLKCSVRFVDGTRVQIDGLTRDSKLIAQTLLAHRVDAVPPTDELGPWRVLRWLLPVVIVASASALVLMFRYVTAHDGTRLAPDGEGNVELQPELGDSEMALLTVGGIICVITLILSLVMMGIHVLSRVTGRR